jgi:hypothetical protein
MRKTNNCNHEMSIYSTYFHFICILTHRIYTYEIAMIEITNTNEDLIGVFHRTLKTKLTTYERHCTA